MQGVRPRDTKYLFVTRFFASSLLALNGDHFYLRDETVNYSASLRELSSSNPV